MQLSLAVTLVMFAREAPRRPCRRRDSVHNCTRPPADIGRRFLRPFFVSWPLAHFLCAGLVPRPGIDVGQRGVGSRRRTAAATAGRSQPNTLHRVRSGQVRSARAPRCTSEVAAELRVADGWALVDNGRGLGPSNFSAKVYCIRVSFSEVMKLAFTYISRSKCCDYFCRSRALMPSVRLSVF